MSGRGFFFLRLLGVVILVGVMLAGGALLFRAGQAQGYQMGVAASAAANAAGGQAPSTAPLAPYGPGYWPAYGPYYPYAHFGFFPFGWLCGSIFFVFLILFLIRWIFFPHRWRHDGKGGWGQHGWGEHSHEHGPYGWGPYGWGPQAPGKDQPPAETGSGGAQPGQGASGTPA
jgi:hypothetical protein